MSNLEHPKDYLQQHHLNHVQHHEGREENWHQGWAPLTSSWASLGSKYMRPTWDDSR